MLSYGCTRLEIGLQSIYEDVARDTNRGHTVAAVGSCFRLAKNAGFKVRPLDLTSSNASLLCCIASELYCNYLKCPALYIQAIFEKGCAGKGKNGYQAEDLSEVLSSCILVLGKSSCSNLLLWFCQVIAHMMPDLPNVGWERDIESFREFFENPAFRTDGLKVYPTLVIRGTGLYELWKAGLYRNYEPVQLIDLVARILALVPPWVRLLLIFRFDKQLNSCASAETCRLLQ